MKSRGNDELISKCGLHVRWKVKGPIVLEAPEIQRGLSEEGWRLCCVAAHSMARGARLAAAWLLLLLLAQCAATPDGPPPPDSLDEDGADDGAEDDEADLPPSPPVITTALPAAP